MSLKSFEINYGFNGEASTASLSFVVQKKTCGGYEDQPSIGTFGETARTTNTVIDEKIKDFIINEIKESKEAGFKTLSYELVDKEAKRLESIAVLVRGVTAPPVGSDLNYFGRLFPAAEIGGISGAPLGQSSVILNGQLAVIGSTFSVVSASSGDETGTLFYSGGRVVGQAPQGFFSSALLAQLSSNEKSAEVRYGYYLSDLKKLLDEAGYVVVAGYPTESNFILMDFGGSLKDVVGSLASMFGLYWSVRGNKITFYKSTDLMALDVPKFNEDPDPTILSSSQSKDILGKSSVGVIVGSSAPESFSGGGGSRVGSKKITFISVPLIKMFKENNGWKSLSYFYTFFKFGKSPAVFDLIVLYLLSQKRIPTNSKFFEKFYFARGDDSEDDDSVGEINSEVLVLPELESNAERADQLKRDFDFIKTGDKFIAVSTDAGPAPLPSQQPIFGLLEALANTVGALYISRPVSKFFTDNYVIAAGGLSVAGPYLGTTKIVDVPELREIASLVQFCFDKEKEGDKITIRNLYFITNNQETPVLNADASYHYVGIGDLLSQIDTEDVLKDVQRVTEGGGGIINYNNYNYVIADATLDGDLEEMMGSSDAIFTDAMLTAKNKIRVPATKEDSDSSGSSSGEDPYPSEFKSFIVRDGSRPLSSVDVMKFDGTTDEAEYLDANFSSLVGPAFYPESSSVTYDGLKIPSDNPLLTSLSVSFSSGGIETSFQYSNKDFLSADNQVIMSGYKTNSARNFYKALRTRQKNFLGVR